MLMKIIVTGSLGNISKPLSELLVSQGHTLTVISSNPDKENEIDALGASAAIGSLRDADFLTNTFTGADAVYCMIPLTLSEPDLRLYMREVANNYVQAMKQARIKRVVFLSGWVADLLEGENLETPFSTLPDASTTIMRPASFYTNFYQSIGLIKSGSNLMGNCGGDDRIVFVSPADIAEAVAEDLVLRPADNTVRYVGSEEMTCNEAATILGTAIGKPDLKWLLLSDEEMLAGLKMANLPQSVAETLVAMQAAMHSGKALENFHASNPVMGKVKLAAFAKEFATVYNKE
jgi:NAD(P)H dehydrogenase (quinone)